LQLRFGLPIYRPHKSVFFAFFALLLSIVVVLLLVGVTEVAFNRLGFTRVEVVLILIGTFLGSSVNIPFHKIKSVNRILQLEEVRFFWISYRIPHFAWEEVSTTVAVNLGGALIPTAVSLYLLKAHPQLLAQASIGVAITALVVHLVARKVPGLGITTPAFVPPITAALVAYLLSPTSPNVIAYVAGTLGTLIGADLSNLHDIATLGAPVVSIGGAGTFDGVFLSGILAALLV
jgi:uncharacterized membrane protein